MDTLMRLTRNVIVASLLLLLLSFGMLAQAPTHKPESKAPRLFTSPPPARVNVNCNAAAVYHRVTHTGDALEVNFHSNGACKLVNFSNTAIFGTNEISLEKGDNFVDIYDSGRTTFCVENQKCPPEEKSGAPKKSSNDGSGHLVPAAQTFKDVFFSNPNEIIVP